VADAKKAISYGVDGIVVSNHAGRQVDGVIASLDALENIVNAVVDKTYIMFDSGIRGASECKVCVCWETVGLGIEYYGRGRGEACHEVTTGGF
jgi:hypothetical protein